ncbi:MAG: hypothetical protein AB7V18_19450 [Pyrinomonadaceae bacterium]
MFKSHFANGNPFARVELRAINRTDGAVAVGQILVLNFNLDAPTATGGELGGGPGTPTGTGTLTAPAPYGTEDGIFCNVDEGTTPAQGVQQMYVVVTNLLDGSGADGTEIVVCLQGVVTVDTVSGNYDVGDTLMATTTAANRELIAYAAGDGNRPIAICLTEQDSATSVRAMFFGWNAFFATGNEA